MNIIYGVPSSPLPRTPATRYLSTNPLRREQGIRLLTYTLPEPLRVVLMRGLRRPPLFDGQRTELALQTVYRQRLSDEGLASASLMTRSALVLTELEVTRRTIEAPLASISRVTRNALLVAQGAELRRLYFALVAQIGPAAALAVFQRGLDAIG
jgi:hypothetical protein